MYSGTSATSPRGTFYAEVLIGGAPQPLYQRADGRCFVAGVPGTAYTVRVASVTGGRVEVVASVDGRHVLDDEPADPYRCRGLVASGAYEFKGWRVSASETRAFTFADPEASVAVAATGSASNVGVIGLAVHRERRATWTAAYDSLPVAAASAGPATYATRGLTRSADLGTGMGAAQHDPVGRTDFTRDGYGPDILAIGYATEDALRAMGLLVPADPDPFPGAGQTGYAKYQH